MKPNKIKGCKHECEVKQVTDVFDGGVHQYHVNGDVCIKCGKLMGFDVDEDDETLGSYNQHLTDIDNG